MRSHGLGRKDLQRKKMKGKIKGKGNLLGPAGMGAAGTAKTSTVGTVETSTMGTAKIGAVGMVETGAEGAAGMGAMGMTGIGIAMFATIPSPSKVSTDMETSIQIKRRLQQGAT